MIHRKRPFGTALAIVLAASAWGMAPAVSAPAERSDVPPPLACLDVKSGDGTLTNDLPVDLLGTAKTTVDFEVEVVAPSCSDGTYHIEVYDYVPGGTGALLAEARLPGNGTTIVGTSFTLESADEDACVVVQVTTTDARGRVIDVAPDDGLGQPLGPGDDCPGGASVWK